MSRNGSGTYSLPAGNPVVTGTTISTTWANNTLNDLAAAMTDSVAADGQTPMTGDLDLNSNKVVNLAAGTIAGDAVEYSQFISSTTTSVNITGGSVNGTTIGETTRSSGKFTTLQANAATTLTSTLDVTGVATFAANSQFNGTGALKLPVGTTGQQPTPATGMIRYNSTISNFEGYYAASWIPIGGVAGGSNTQVQYNNSGALAGSSAFTFDGTVLTVPKITFASSNTPSLTNYQGGAVTSGTSVASTSGTSIDFTSIPSWVKRITVMLSGVSVNGTSPLQIQLGDSGGVETTSYLSNTGIVTGGYVGAAGATSATSGFVMQYIFVDAANTNSGQLVLTNLSGNIWIANGMLGAGTDGRMWINSGTKTLSSTLDRIRLTTVNGTDTFDAGTINILYE
jgi:hypothetical protein